METLPVERSDSPRLAADRFLDDLQAWAHACMARLNGVTPLDGHDQCTFTTSWSPLVRWRNDAPVLAFMRALRDRTREHSVATGAWRHGYWRRQEAHHGTEHFELFLGTLLRLDPDDAATVEQLNDAAEHFGNWDNAPHGIPDFFDWERGLFVSTHLGVDVVSLDPAHRINIPDHFRLVNICLLVHDAGGDARYLELAQTHIRRWSEALRECGEIPLALDTDGPIVDAGDETRQRVSAIGQASAIGQSAQVTPLDRAENYLASNAIETLLRLGETDAARRLLDVITPEIADPDASAAVHSLRAYRRSTGDTRFDGQIIAAAEALGDRPPQAIGIEPIVKRARRPRGIGKRKDMPDWFEDGNPARQGAALLALAAEITSNEAWTTRALDLARARFRLATRVYDSGRNHGCSARSVSAVARGHGRDNNAGMVTAVLEPLLERSG